ncbi:unnamed protein product [Victoria cruziana]
MVRWSHPSVALAGLLTLFLFGPTITLVDATRLRPAAAAGTNFPSFREAPIFRNGKNCSSQTIHIAMTLDTNYIRGSVAAVLSILQHASCPENLAFHFLSLRREQELHQTMRTTFPYLNFRLYRFNPGLVRGKISTSIRQALDQPLNYARIYLADILRPEIRRVIYLDSDLVVVDDIAKLWGVDLGDKVLGAPEYCHANFTDYFTDAFWSNPRFSRTFHDRKACYFNTGVMIMDVQKWREGGYTRKIENWMIIQRHIRIYHLGSLPPFLLVFAGNIQRVEHRWNQHGLGGDNFRGNCRSLHPGPVSLLHWSGKGKPWLRLDSGRPCPVDGLWAPYDLFRSSSLLLDE